MSALQRLREAALELVHSIPGPLSRIVIRCPPHEVELEWFAIQPTSPPMPVQPPSPTAEYAEDDTAHVVLAPIVGTFYRAPHPGAEPFVSVGSVVEPGQTLGIIEAMKLMNHIVAEIHGRVTRICVDDGGRVEFEQPLLVLEPIDDEQGCLRGPDV
jgi:acetyl-CoA carboxylase biotin carboxyl carrier protein